MIVLCFRLRDAEKENTSLKEKAKKDAVRLDRLESERDKLENKYIFHLYSNEL